MPYIVRFFLFPFAFAAVVLSIVPLQNEARAGSGFCP